MICTQIPIKTHVEKAHPWDVALAPKMILMPEIVSFELYADHPLKIPLPGQVFGACKTPTQKFRNFSRVYAPAHQFTSVVSDMVEICAG